MGKSSRRKAEKKDALRRLWPYCMRCQRKVQTVKFTPAGAPGMMRMIARCHGEYAESVVPMRALFEGQVHGENPIAFPAEKPKTKMEGDAPA